jgi:hypothetical protein
MNLPYQLPREFYFGKIVEGLIIVGLVCRSLLYRAKVDGGKGVHRRSLLSTNLWLEYIANFEARTVCGMRVD